MLQILFRSVDYWIVEKPAGMSFHAESEELGVMQTLAISYPDQSFYPVHRLDKMTSGLLIVACHAVAAAEFGKMFENHEMEKRYLALSVKKPKKKQGTISGGMAPSRRGQWKLTQDNENLAVTQFFSSAFQGFRVFIVRPLTGKTHQIRVALKSLGSPILGDLRYSGEGADRGYLHAYSLQFNWRGEMKSYLSLPISGEHFSSELSDFVTTQFDESLLKWPGKK
ncbi:MAG: TIGR01621 family pseudouridine synthase [Gammaproteobacteria bacterium]|nr:TIGR01621 family pseudouridine synthase [Gammaproteobacteria bacterium]MBU1467978.1 TIGR01621 family pseudouridine synthase [Gammaproteobacteria bacterium]MBU2020802.1 TIGR01621 family pseudouridine synthase [Gammaproteobacteria bacterium]MBU2317131.1 TIGR01621 family pseudouridine synthase [Gammaproteobacteria bacterium]MBU2412983.1 TIGR01621 family pseudouridine synthase [Gammaproteobacteria bacterium]